MNEERCAQCGTPAAPGARFCESCGAPLAAASQPVQGPASVEPAAAYAAPGAQVPYQGVAPRFVAILIDIIIIGIISGILSTPLLSSIVSTSGTVTLGAAYYATAVIEAVITLLYFTLLLGHYGQSVGMMIVKIKVVKEADFSAISYGEAATRTILLLIDELRMSSHTCLVQSLSGPQTRNSASVIASRTLSY